MEENRWPTSVDQFTFIWQVFRVLYSHTIIFLATFENQYIQIVNNFEGLKSPIFVCFMDSLPFSKSVRSPSRVSRKSESDKGTLKTRISKMSREVFLIVMWSIMETRSNYMFWKNHHYANFKEFRGNARSIKLSYSTTLKLYCFIFNKTHLSKRISWQAT